MLKAQALLGKHGLTKRDIEANKAKSVCEHHLFRQSQRRPPKWKCDICDVVSRNFRCGMYYHCASQIVFVGEEADVALAEYICHFAIKAAEKAWKEYSSTLSSEERKERATRNDFLCGFSKGLGTSFSRQVDELDLHPVIQKPQSVNEFFSSRKWSKIRPSKASRNYIDIHIDAGWAAGAEFTYQKGIRASN